MERTEMKMKGYNYIAWQNDVGAILETDAVPIRASNSKRAALEYWMYLSENSGMTKYHKEMMEEEGEIPLPGSLSVIETKNFSLQKEKMKPETFSFGYEDDFDGDEDPINGELMVW